MLLYNITDFRYILKPNFRVCFKYDRFDRLFSALAENFVPLPPSFAYFTRAGWFFSNGPHFISSWSFWKNFQIKYGLMFWIFLETDIVNKYCKLQGPFHFEKLEQQAPWTKVNIPNAFLTVTKLISSVVNRNFKVKYWSNAKISDPVLHFSLKLTTS